VPLRTPAGERPSAPWRAVRPESETGAKRPPAAARCANAKRGCASQTKRAGRHGIGWDALASAAVMASEATPSSPEHAAGLLRAVGPRNDPRPPHFTGTSCVIY
jgi:hypothetical protein